MTLEENFDYQPDERIVLHSQKYLDDFAIGFAEWLNGLDINDYVLQKHISSNELLEIYKKEKGV
jgi:hypothetical protein